ncbi:MAG: AraC family transcriptional regulator [Bacteroidetes bacterium]|nr:MAG: AraC family transcriptional regulator [Bacteroidota bacterium]
MQTALFIGSVIGILNSFILIIFALVSKKGNRLVNRLFALFVFVLTLRISKSILLTFSDGLHDLLLTLGLSGFLAIGPTFYLLSEAAMDPRFTWKWKQVIHFLPAIIFTFLWIFLDQIRNDRVIWHLFYRTIMLQYMIYVTLAIFRIKNRSGERTQLKNRLNLMAVFLLAIWLAYFLNEVAGFPYIAGAVLYSVLIYFSLIIILNKGYIINSSAPKYEKTGLDVDENKRLLSALDFLMEQEHIYRDNTLSLTKLAKRLKTNTHALSQVINENKQKTFFELIGFYRIEEAKILLQQQKQLKISDIAFDVGYNSLSAFNSAFKKNTGHTPSQYRNGKTGS